MSRKDADQPVSFGLLSTLSDEDLWSFFECGIRKVLKKNEEVLQVGQRNGSLYVVMEGALRILRKIENNEVSLGHLEPGSFFGEISLFDPGPATATVRAAGRSVVVEIRRKHLDHFIEMKPGPGTKVLLALLEDMARRFRHTDERLKDMFLWRNVVPE
jgi:CRP-like cAMP-binding protein